MFGSEVIEVGRGVALLFFFMSLIASAFCEAVENFLKTRATYLETGIKELLGRDNEELVRRFYEHPMIAALYHGTYVPGSKSLPSYIPRQNFAVAVLDILRPANLVAPLSLESLRASLDTVEASNPAKRVVLTALDSTTADLAKVRQALESWFDGTMDRVSGWYKRRSGYALAALGLFAAVTMNVDAITVAKHLISDKALRDAAVAQAEKVTEAGQDETSQTLNELKRDLAAIGYPIGWHFTERGYPVPIPQAGCVASQKPDTATSSTPQTATNKATYACQGNSSAIIFAIPGWIITALAITLGAPFWFDMLNKLMVVRSTVKPTEKSPDEPSQDASKKTPASTPAPDAAPPPDDGAIADGQAPGDQSAEAMRLAVTAAAFVPMEWAQGDPQRGLA